MTTPAPRDVWQSVLHSAAGALPSQTPTWTDWLCATRGYVDASRLYELRDGRRAVLPMAGMTAGGVRVAAEAMPYGFGYGGLLVEGGPATGADVRAVLEDLRRQPLVRTGVSPSPLEAEVWSSAAPPGAVRTPVLSQVVDLDGGFGTVWAQRYGRNTRNKVRRAEKASLDVRRTTGPDLVTTFGALHRQSVDRWAAQRGQPRWVGQAVERRRDRTGQIASARTALGDMLAGWTAHLDGEPVAAYVLLRFGEQAVFWISAMNRDLADRTFAGYLLQSMAIEEACAGGARWYHLGESDPGSGVERFKAAFGAAPFRGETLRFERVPLTAALGGARRLAGAAAAVGNRLRSRHVFTGV